MTEEYQELIHDQHFLVMCRPRTLLKIQQHFQQQIRMPQQYFQLLSNHSPCCHQYPLSGVLPVTSIPEQKYGKIARPQSATSLISKFLTRDNSCNEIWLTAINVLIIHIIDKDTVCFCTFLTLRQSVSSFAILQRNEKQNHGKMLAESVTHNLSNIYNYDSDSKHFIIRRK